MKAHRILTSALLALLASGPLAAQTGYEPARDEAGYGTATLDARVARLERRLSGQPLTEMSQDIGNLQDEVKKLRGTVEELHNNFEKFRKQAREQQMVLERKNQEMEDRLRAFLPSAPGLPAGAGMVDAQGGVTVPASGGIRPALQAAQVPAPDAVLVAPVAPPPVDPELRKRDYERAFETLKAGKYTDAIAEFQAFTAKYPTGDFSDNAYYWLGEAHYVNRDFAVAREAFRQMIAGFPQSAKVPDAELKLAFIEYENQQFGKAREMLTALIKQHPDSSAAKMAEKRLERMTQENH